MVFGENFVLVKTWFFSENMGYCILSFAIHLMENIHSCNFDRWISYFSCGRNFTSITWLGEILSIKNTSYFSYVFSLIIYKLVTWLYIVELYFFSKHNIVFPLALEKWIKKKDIVFTKYLAWSEPFCGCLSFFT